ncbi:MAG: bifunctional [glutamine synthetase] adenylyltransferase/[glutamine synthetase]-adenylyl-L-tyrosine phosphorylase [Alphaproteobacteria bacterium]|nr:bifunctional [glutamine synthetase] adenylyltransferase/[glutamine synthetase]-adenylyl-L-tyrosine phosphorylase [Alphaproteobacteria bacterium]MBV9694598.1 bifunctional [glutamine synthetase] adenylyltransferase/[glutamine synthetase]-adenylyl-L-tyrosine phosphorylase [Alphaproteobacteria bacterium]
MHAFDSTRPLPEAFDRARAERTLAALAGEGVALEGREAAIVASAAGNAPYLARLLVRQHALLRDLFAQGPQPAVEAACRLALSAAECASEAEAMARLRRAKRAAALAIALADIAGVWPLERVTRALCEFADAAVQGALRFLLREAAERQALESKDGAALEATTGLVVLAMGKYGAFELNYSSDIDLVVFYEAQRFPFRKRDDPRGAAVDIVRGLVRLLSETTSDGYVFRTDLRLRPDAGATQVAISTDAAEAYYEAMGQNWERAAMIKARACAGDREAGARFLKAIEPFVWRRNLDFAAIEDIHSIKRQIHAHQGHGRIAVAGHNIKLGRGGIREIEFFAQTQQLILGGRNRSLRAAATVAALDALHARGLLGDDAVRELKDCYRFLRTLEHRLQMVEDQQTHTLPKSDDELAHIACFMGSPDGATFAAELTRVLETVQGHYGRLFERAEPLAARQGSLVFTGVEDDPETLATLTEMGFRDVRHVANAIRGWHHGRIRATRSARARELLTKLVPALLDALAASAEPDAAFMQFDRFVSNLPAGVQLFSLFLARPELLKLVADVAGSTPRLASHLAQTPATLDALLDSHFLEELPSRAALDQALDEQMARAADHESRLDAARRFAKEQTFRVGVQIIEGRLAPAAAGTHFTHIAESVVVHLLRAVGAELGPQPAGGRFAVVALGRLGGREMTATSDLDLVFVYDAPDLVPASVHFARKAQRLIAALTVFTSAGGLYDVDMRLRPSGNKGPVAVSLESFRRYHQREAWTWERLALTRARTVAGDAGLCAEVERAIAATLHAPAEPARLIADVREMRLKLASQFPAKSRWDLKFAAGGLVDVEFAAQTLELLRHVFDTNTIAALEKLGGCDDLAAAASLQQSLLQILRLAVDGTLDPARATPGLKALLVRAAAAADFADLERRLAEAQDKARAAFEQILG